MDLDFQPDDGLDFELDFQPDEAPKGASSPYIAPTGSMPVTREELSWGREARTKPKKSLLTRVGEEAGGMADAAGRLIVGGGAFALSTLPAAANRINEHLQGRGNQGSLEHDIETLSKKMTDAVFYNDQGIPEAGEKYNDAVNEAINRVGMPMLGHHLPGRLAVPSAKELAKFSDVGKKMEEMKAANEAARNAEILKKDFKVDDIPQEVRDAQSVLNAQDAGGAFKPEAVAPDMSKQMELPFTNSPVEKMAAEKAAESPQMDLFAKGEDPRIISNEAEAARNAAGEQAARTAEQEVKAREIEDAHAARQQELALEPDPVVREMKVIESSTLREQMLDDLQDQLTASAYKADRVRKMRTSRFGGGESGSAPVINHIAKLIEDTAKKGADALRDLHGTLYKQYADSGYKNKAYLDAAHEVVQREVQVRKQEQYVDNVNNPKMGVVGPSGETHIPSGTKVMATHGVKFKEPTRATVVGEKQMQINGQPYRFPVVDFGNGEVRTLGYGDVKQVFGGPKFTPPKNQRGSAPVINDAAKLFEKVLGKTGDFFREPKPAKEILEQALLEKDGRGMNSLEAGGNLTAEKRNSTFIREGVRWIQGAIKKAEETDRIFVKSSEKDFKKLSRQEISDLADVVKEEMFNRSITPEQVLQLGLTKDQLAAYNSMKQMHNEAWRQQNDTRIRQGLAPITKSEYYLSSRWQGDFRLPVLDAAGKLKWYLAADSKMGLERQWKALSKQFPELVKGKEHTVKTSKNINDIQGTLANAIDVLGRDDPAVLRLKEWAEQQAIVEGRGALGQEKHFENKANVRGFVGDRPGKGSRAEAIALFEQQMQYARNAFKWSELQKATDGLKEVMNSPELAKQQPNNMAYMKDYIRNHMGMGEAKWVAALEDALRSKGLSPHVIGTAVGGVKTLFIMQKMAFSAGFVLSNAIQLVNILPHMVKESLNPAYQAAAVAQGLVLGPMMALGHYINAMGGKKNIHTMLQDKFITDAMKYAEVNGITARSVLDESPISNSFSALGKVENFAGQTLSIPETVLRSTAYMMATSLLRATGKFGKDHLALFQKAEEMVNIAMGDYRQGERATVFSKLGTAGNALNTLQTYPMNFYQQYNLMARQALKGNVAPIIAMLTAQGLVAGAMGVPGFNETDKLIDWFKGKVSNETYAKIKDVSLKEAVLNAGGQSALYGPLSTETGVGLTSRVTAPGLTDMVTSPAGPGIDLAKQMGSLGNLAMDPMNQDKQTQALVNSVPTGIQGAMETGPLRDRMSVSAADGKRMYRKTTDVADHKGMYARTPEEERLRAWGLRSQGEVFEKDMAYRLSQKEMETTKRGGSIINDIYAASRRQDVKQTQELVKLYVQITGKELTNTQIEKQIMDEYTSAFQRAVGNAKTVDALKAVKQMQEFFKEKHAN